MPRNRRSGNTTLPRVDEICAEIYEERLREEAMPFMPGAVDQMAKLAMGKGNTALRACEKLISLGHEKPPTRLDDLQSRLGDGRVNVTITLQGADGNPLHLPVSNVPIDVTPVLVDEDVEDAEVIPYEGEGSEPDPLLNISIKGLPSTK